MEFDYNAAFCPLRHFEHTDAGALSNPVFFLVGSIDANCSHKACLPPSNPSINGFFPSLFWFSFYAVPAYDFLLHTFFQTLALFKQNWFFPHISAKTTIVASLFVFLLGSSRDHQHSLAFPPISLSRSTTHLCLFPPDHHGLQHRTLLLHTIKFFCNILVALWPTRSAETEHFRGDKSSTLAVWSPRITLYTLCHTTVYRSERVRSRYRASVRVQFFLSSSATMKSSFAITSANRRS